MKGRRILRPLRPRTMGQALVETALAAPFLVMLLLGGAQVGSIAYDQVSLDTAAREGARAGAAAPTHAVYSFQSASQWYNSAVPATYIYTCKAADFASGANPICEGAVNAAGFLDSSKFTTNPCTSGQACVTITVVPPASLQREVRGAPEAILTASGSCVPKSKFATVTGTVSGAPSGSAVTFTDTNSPPDSLTSTTSGSTYTACINAQSGTIASITIAAQDGPAGCGGYTQTLTLTNVQANTTTNQDIVLQAEPACTTATTSTTTSSTTTTSSSTSTSTSATSTVTGPATGCSAHPVDDSYYFTVSITYPAPIFIPFLNTLFQTSSGIRMINTSVTYPVDPCTMTGNGTE